MQKIKKHLPLVVIISILFGTGVVFANVFISQNKIGVSTVRGEEDGEDKPEVKDNEDEKDEAKDNEDEKDNEIKDNEDEKDEVKTHTIRTSATGQKIEDNEDETDEVDEADEADSESGDLQEEIQDLKKDIKKVESRISVLSANGTDTQSLSVSLAEVRDLVGQAEVKITTSVIGVDALLESADNKLGRLQRLVKMTLGDEDEADDDETGKDATEKIQEMAKEVVKTEVKLNAIAERGVDVSVLKTSLNGVKDLLSQAKEKLTAGDFVSAESLAEVAEKKLESLEHAMELAYGDDDSEDGDEADEYKNEVASFVHNLGDISEMDSGIGQQVSVVAQAQNASSAKVENSIKDIKSRGGFAKFFIGPKYGSIAEVQTAITENQTRISVLLGLINQVTDPIVKQVLQDQIKQFQQENTRLQAFITENESGISLFGWLMKMFA